MNDIVELNDILHENINKKENKKMYNKNHYYKNHEKKKEYFRLYWAERKKKLYF